MAYISNNKERSKLVSIGFKIIVLIFFGFFILLGLYTPKVFEYLRGKEKIINILTFTDMISSEAVEMFEKEFGIPVHIVYFESNDELLTKLKIDRGKGYDLIITTDYMIEIFRRHNFLHPIEHKRIDHLQDIDNFFLARFFDPENEFSLPYSWTVYGLAYRREFFKGIIKKPSWRLIFEKKENDYKISMPNELRELIFFASLYLFGRTSDLSEEELDLVRDLLIKQKEYVECYTSEKQDYLLYGGIVPLVVCESLFVRKLQAENPLKWKEFDFVVPQEGSLLTIEHLAILALTEKLDSVYKLINFLLSTEVAVLNSKIGGFNPTNKRAYASLDKEIIENPNYFPDRNLLKKMDTLNNELSLDKMDDLWLSVKVA